MAVDKTRIFIPIVGAIAAMVVIGLILSSNHKQREKERREQQAREAAAAIRKKNEAWITRLASGTVPEWSRKNPSPNSDLKVASCEIEDRETPYDSEKHQFELVLHECELFDDAIWYIRDGSLKLVLEGAGKGGVFGKTSAWPWVDERWARSFQRRLRTGHKRVEIAFEPGAYGPTSIWEQSGLDKPATVSGFTGQAVAFRIVIGSRDVIVDWTPYGKDAAGEEAAAKVLFDVEPTETTKAQDLRASMSAHEVETLREELGKAHSARRWNQGQQKQFLQVCLGARADDSSTNTQTCECNLEMVMRRFPSFGAYGRYVDGHRARKPDSELAGWFGSCLAAYGD